MMKRTNTFSAEFIASRKPLVAGLPIAQRKVAQEGGCGVVGFASSVPVCGRHIFEPSIQMHNRGNGKGGGIAAASFAAEDLGVDAAVLRDDYILQVALLDPDAAERIEEDFIRPNLRIDHKEKLKPVADYRQLGLDVRPPDIVRYFVRAKEKELARFAEQNNLSSASARAVEDEFIYQNSFHLNHNCYASLGEKKAFVLSHARNLMIFKIVGYAEQVVQYYGLLRANIWIAHQRYPTKGRVWHPGGTHPFIGMNQALVHNGDFANYFSIVQYLRQHNIAPLFLTDTEVAVQLFDLWHRIYKYPIEYVIEAMAPTTELDFDRLPDEKKRIYRSIQAMQMHGSPDGPWFFIIANSNPDQNKFNLIGITDTAMLRPQVFALQEGDASIGLIASEKQAIDATLHSLASEDSRFRLIADRYWNARGGSHVDGGAFIFTVEGNNGEMQLSCTDKFGKAVTAPEGRWTVDFGTEPGVPDNSAELTNSIEKSLAAGNCEQLFENVSSSLQSWDFDNLRWFLNQVEDIAQKDHSSFECALELLAMLNDRRCDFGEIKRSVILQAVRQSINNILDAVVSIADGGKVAVRRIDWDSRQSLRPPRKGENVLVVCAAKFPPEGDDCDACLIVRAYQLGWKRFIVYSLKGQRFTGCGFGPETDGVRIDVFGSSGDYLASGIDGMQIYVHGNAQDQVAQIMKTGTLVIHGDAGQAFMYGAKGGQVYVMGNAAGRPLINAVGRPRVVINGTCLDFLAESFMAGDPYYGGGFVVLNGLRFDDKGSVCEQETPYPGANLFSLASGGAIFVRDPHNKLVVEQLNGGQFADFTEQDWELILPYLQANEKYFGISIERDLLTVDGVRKPPQQVYRKVKAVKLAVLAKEAIPE
jgi:glutamate synthase domain-containing protein 1/glutamate synthase domain-containing protein 3